MPVSYFEGSLPVTEGWDDRPAAYLASGETYGPERDEARTRGWPVSTMAAEHLHLLIEPVRVATELIRELGIASPTSENRHPRSVR